MNSRVLIPILCLGAVAFACGPRTRDDAAVKQSGAPIAASANRATRTAPAARAGGDTKATGPIQSELYVRAHESSVRLALYVENTSARSIELTFPTGQTHEFVIMDTLGRELWRWGRDRMFTQTLRNRLLSRGETLNIEETWRAAALPPGAYVARATLKSENYPVTRQARFTVTGTTVAAR